MGRGGFGGCGERRDGVKGEGEEEGEEVEEGGGVEGAHIWDMLLDSGSVDRYDR